MKVKDVSGSDGYYIEIVPGAGLRADDDLVGLQTHIAAPYDTHDELWTFKRKKFLKAVAKALSVIIYERDAVAEAEGGPEPGYYR